MRLLIATQAVDRADPVLGFFHRWIEEFARSSASVRVICLKRGDFSLPEHVRVFSLGKEVARAGRLRYALRFLRLAWRLRREYDAVFVHMNEEYVLIAGLLWRMLGKRVVLWRNHKLGTWRSRLAGRLAHAVCHTSPEAYVAAFPNAVRMPIGIDAGQFAFARERTDPRSILFFGRLDRIKRPDSFIDALLILQGEGAEFRAVLCGDPTVPGDPYAAALRERAEPLMRAGLVEFRTGVRHAEAPALYASHAIYANLTPSGSFDKTIGEAMASGCVVVAANEAVREAVPGRGVVDPDSPRSVADGLRAALGLSEQERAALAARGREYVEREHSLALLAERACAILQKPR